MLGDRRFKPGVYSHFKNGAQFFAHRLIRDAERDVKMVLLSMVGKPESRVLRSITNFMSPAPLQDNNTGQFYRFEYKSESALIYTKVTPGTLTYRERMNLAGMLKLGDRVTIELVDHEVISGNVDSIGDKFVCVRDDERNNINWADIQELILILDGEEYLGTLA